MATVTPRRLLIFKIQKSLSELSLSQLQTVARSIDGGQQSDILENLSEPEVYELVVEYIRSDKLRAMEDEGMSQLLCLEDLLTNLLLQEGARDSPPGDVMPRQGEPPRTQQPGNVVPRQVEPQRTLQPGDVPPTPLQDERPTATSVAGHIVGHPPVADSDQPNRHSVEDRGIRLPTRDSTTLTPATSSFTGTGGALLGRMSSSSTDQVVRLTDVAALLPRKEFKLHGGQISDAGSDMSYSSLCKQIDEGL